MHNSTGMYVMWSFTMLKKTDILFAEMSIGYALVSSLFFFFSFSFFFCSPKVLLFLHISKQKKKTLLQKKFVSGIYSCVMEHKIQKNA